jgi:hypothetical protein
MGVLACDRNGCENIMCDRYSHEFGYICEECFKRLCSLGVSVGIREFMGAGCDYWGRDEAATRAYFESIFISRHAVD